MISKFINQKHLIKIKIILFYRTYLLQINIDYNNIYL